MSRFFDILLSLIGLLLLSPLMVPVMVLLKLTGEHDIFYRQNRIGRLGKEFGLIKFATMLRASPTLPGGLHTEKNDPRMLPLGPLLRKTKINELPQLLNILMGDMSIVGYRPTVREHFDAYPQKAKDLLFGSRPGLTGVGSIFFRNEEQILHEVEDKRKFHSEVIGPFKAELECWYVQHRNLVSYFGLILLTVWVVFNPKDTNWRKLFPDLPPVPDELKPYIG